MLYRNTNICLNRRMPTQSRLSLLGIANAGDTHTHKWANWLVDHGHAVRILSFVPINAVERAALRPEVRLEPWVLPQLHLRKFWITAHNLRKLRVSFHRHSTDLVHVHFLAHGAWYAALSGARPLVVSVMGGGDMDQVKRPSPITRALTRFTLRRASAAVCWSEGLRKSVQPLLRSGAHCEVIVVGVDHGLFNQRNNKLPDRQRFGLSAEDIVIASPRLFWERCNIDVIVEAVARVSRRLPNIRLLLLLYRASDFPEYPHHIQQMVARLGIEKNVVFVPPVPYQDMPTLFNAADCTVSIPINDGTPMSVVESMACGTPVVVQDQPDLDPGVFKHEENVLRVQPRDPEAVASAIIRIITDIALRTHLMENGLNLSLRFGYEEQMRRMLSLYYAILANQ